MRTKHFSQCIFQSSKIARTFNLSAFSKKAVAPGAICTEIISWSRPSTHPYFIEGIRDPRNQESVTEVGNARRYKRE